MDTVKIEDDEQAQEVLDIIQSLTPEEKKRFLEYLNSLLKTQAKNRATPVSNINQ